MIFSTSAIYFTLLYILFFFSYQYHLTYHFTSHNWPAPPTIHRGVEWSQFLKCSLLDCSLSANFLIFLLLILLSVVLSPLLFIYNIIAVMIDIDTLQFRGSKNLTYRQQTTDKKVNKREPTLQATSKFGLCYTPCILALIYG